MRSLLFVSIVVGLIAIPNDRQVFDLHVDLAGDGVGGDPPQEGDRFDNSIDSECVLDVNCEEDGDSCDNGWGTECTAHHQERKMFSGLICSSSEGNECFIWNPPAICKFRVTCGFDEDENCVTTVNVTNTLASTDCFTLPLPL